MRRPHQYVVYNPTCTHNTATVTGNTATVTGNIATVTGNTATVTGDNTTITGDSATVTCNIATVTGNMATLTGDSATVTRNTATVTGDGATVPRSIATMTRDIATVMGDIATVKVLTSKMVFALFIMRFIPHERAFLLPKCKGMSQMALLSAVVVFVAFVNTIQGVLPALKMVQQLFYHRYKTNNPPTLCLLYAQVLLAIL